MESLSPETPCTVASDGGARGGIELDILKMSMKLKNPKCKSVNFSLVSE